MTLRQLRVVPTVGLAVAAVCWLVLAGGPGSVEVAATIDSVGTWGWIIGTWGHFLIWRLSLRRIRRFRPSPAELDRALGSRDDRRPDKVTHDGQPVMLPPGWSYELAPQKVMVASGARRGWSAWVDAEGASIRPRWSLMPAWAVADPDNDAFPTVEHAEDAALREIALRQPVRLRT